MQQSMPEEVQSEKLTYFTGDLIHLGIQTVCTAHKS